MILLYMYPDYKKNQEVWYDNLY